MAATDELAAAISGLLLPLSDEELQAVVSQLDSTVKNRLSDVLKSGRPPADQRRGNQTFAYDNSYGKHGKGDKGKQGKGWGKQDREPKPPMSLVFDPKALPTEAVTGEEVAYQNGTGKPWRIMGESTECFKWDLLPREAVSKDEKADVAEVLQDYAATHGIPLERDSALKLALHRGSFWISFAGGISTDARRFQEAEAA
mmetsp:Transcript_50131/g.92538  ORF Transcript_50131/g.92538 Transcript_50131/m.92538 type:complete len:199 (-) Transcript_50131:155-751(-)